MGTRKLYEVMLETCGDETCPKMTRDSAKKHWRDEREDRIKQSHLRFHAMAGGELDEIQDFRCESGTRKTLTLSTWVNTDLKLFEQKCYDRMLRRTRSEPGWVSVLESLLSNSEFRLALGSRDVGPIGSERSA